MTGNGHVSRCGKERLGTVKAAPTLFKSDGRFFVAFDLPGRKRELRTKGGD